MFCLSRALRCSQLRTRALSRSLSSQSSPPHPEHSTRTTSFGFRTVPEESKETLVKEVFDSVASNYDLMNDATSFGVHRLWKDSYVSSLKPGRRGPMQCIDVAGGTGDIALRILDFARENYADRETTVAVVDINAQMLKEGYRRFKKTMYHNTPQISFHEANAQALPEEVFLDNTFDLYTIAFGIRNCTSIPDVLKEAYRVLKPGGTFACLEFSRVNNPLLSTLYDQYSFTMIPLLGTILAGDRNSYQYLVESIRKFPPQSEFAQMIQEAGFSTGEKVDGGAWEDLWGDLGATWAFLEEGVNHIMTRLDLGVSYSKYMSLYTVAYNYCTSSRTLTSADSFGIGNRIDDLQDEELLKYYAEQWDRYTIGANYINRLFTYLNRHWVKRERDEGRKAVYPVYTLALVQWNIHLFKPIQQKQSKLANAVLRIIESQRNGETIDQGLVKKVIDSLVSLGLDETDPDKACLTEYKNHFETPFLKATEAYYRKESLAFLANNSISDYLKMAEERLKQEEDRVERYLISASRKPLISTCEDVLIREHAPTLWEHFQHLLEFDKDEDLQRMYALLSRLPEGLEPLRKGFEQFVKNAGLSAVLTIVGELEEETDMDPKTYVHTLLHVHNKNLATVRRSFRHEAGFKASLDRACADFVNRNAATGNSSSKSPELIAKYADGLLRKGNKMAEEDELDAELDRVVALVEYVNEKDVFQNFYAKTLSKRLIHNASVSDDAEKSMNSKLKTVCGFEYCYKLERMVIEIGLSKEATEGFREKMQMQSHADADITFNALVLATFLWPLNAPTHEFIIPKEILPTYNRFQMYYQQAHNARRLTWLWNYSKNELRTNYTNQKYIFLTSTFQTAILLQYNHNDTLALDELFAATGIPKDYLKQVLAILVKAKVLIQDEEEQYDLNPSKFYLPIRVNLNMAIRSEQKAETVDVMKTVEEDRKYIIQATIVRVMKARKQMKHQPLIQEVITLLSQRFSPKLPDIKKAIDALLEKDYIDRVENTKDTYTYVA
ncbi:hypothetical protein H0H93_009352 [Arthromyces matolae]|nr:hypothetical protein H0H93_009352 [Arthromyces matolae]